MRRRTIYVIVGLLLAAAVGGYFLWRSRPSHEAPEAAIRSTVARRGSMVVAVTVSGKMEPQARVELTFETPARVAEVYVEEGDRVEAGEALAQLDMDQVELQVERSRAALASAEAQLAQLLAGPRSGEIEQAEANLRAAEAQLDAAEASRDQLARGPSEAGVASAKAQVAQAWTAREVAQDTYDTMEDEGTRKEQASYDLYTAKQELAAAEASLEDLLAGASDEELRAAHARMAAAAAQRDAAQAQLAQLLAATTEEEIAEAQAQVDQARVALELTELSLKNATLRAPLDGLVSKINMKPGETAPTLESPIILLDDSAFHMTVGVDEIDVSRLKEGQEVEISIEALPEAALIGSVRSIAPVATLEGGIVTYDVVIDLAPTDAPIRADMTANATVVVEELADVLQIPTWVVRVDQDTGQTYVHRRVGDDTERVDVQLGARHEGIAQVISGLSPGDEIVRLEDSTAFGFGPQ
ncbi:MAG: efflux RND transporter periplasmic adaptor subunit [Anaerolineae bacterium]